jgi:hypothetical protein
MEIFTPAPFPDLRVKRRDLRLMRGIPAALLAREDPHQTLTRLAFPLRDQVRMDLVAGRKLGQSLIATQGLKRNFRLEGRRKIPSLRHNQRSSS